MTVTNPVASGLRVYALMAASSSASSSLPLPLLLSPPSPISNLDITAFVVLPDNASPTSPG
eukprot:CAMPEP_0171038080 /NCGR_PEP_ID=MMETSP0736-20130129/42847_1 /TAXON_ID=186038 /ORGANISM="Fragilariopsis kerguelensis, Strain L26-C5" /LENGTH=60 /DNA_ID=CAMNT_0011484103 /DNA_START=121 /DNA_END=299 /DNA_ORIENTATION=-